MSSIVELGSLDSDAAKPAFRASAGGEEFLIELDSSAMRKLSDGGIGLAGNPVEAQRGRVRAAAQALYDAGFLTRGPGMPRLFVTAIDIL